MKIETEGTTPFLSEADEVQNLSEENIPVGSEIGIAVDVGTSTVAVKAWALSSKKCLATVAQENAQTRYGSDVIRRISYATRQPLIGSSQITESGPSALHYAIIIQLEKMFAQAVSISAKKLPRGVRPEVKRIVITGNTAMLSFVCSCPIDGMAAAPFSPSSYFGFSTTWQNVVSGTALPKCVEPDSPTPEMLTTLNASVISPDTAVYFPPCIGAFIGADTVCAMISAGFPSPLKSNAVAEMEEFAAKTPLLLADIGTNTEIALYVPATERTTAKILCTSAAAGPAFEGANISWGMSSIEGAIDKVTCTNGNFECRIIGNTTAKGICGSGLISAGAVLLKNGYINNRGAIRRGGSHLGDGSSCIHLTPVIYLSQQDIRNMQLAKSAVRTGLMYMMEQTETPPILCLAGGFGSNLDVTEAETIGLIPSALVRRAVPIGNAALSGASAMLFSKVLRRKATELAANSFQINLAAIPGFQDRYLNSIDF